MPGQAGLRVWFSALLGSALVVFALPATAAAGWEEPVGGANPISAGDTDASEPSMAAIGGIPYVAWRQSGGGGAEIRVARLNAAGTAWEQVGGMVNTLNRGPDDPSLVGIAGVPHVAFVEADDNGDFQVRVARLSGGTTWERVGENDNPANPINASASRNAIEPALAEIAGVPLVAWVEHDGSNNEVRVARLQGDGTGWDKVGETDDAGSPINVALDQNAREPSLAVLGSTPYVAWREWDGSNNELRVARLQSDGSGWDRVGEMDSPASPINESLGGDAREPSLTEIGGVPYIAWRETPPTTGTAQARVARLSVDETKWEKVAGGLSPINKLSNGSATTPSLIGIDGTPYVAWSEAGGGEQLEWVARLNADGTGWEKVPSSASPVDQAAVPSHSSLTTVGGVPYVAYRGLGSTHLQTRVSRLEPELETTAVAGQNGATLVAGVETFGLPYQVGFQYGPGFGFETAVQETSGEFDLVEQKVTGLSPSTTYDYRAFATAGVPAPRVLGVASQFTTDAAPPSDSGGAGDDGSGGGTPDTDAPSLYLGGKKRQELGRSVKVKAECPEEACKVEADGKLVLDPAKDSRRGSASGSTLPPALSAGKVAARGKRTRFRLRSRSAEVPAGETVTLKLGVPKKARSAATKVLRFGGKAKARVTLSVSDAAENEAVARRTIKLTR